MTKNSPLINPSGKTSRFFSNNILLASLTGILLTASFPPLDMPYMAWIALVPLFIGIYDETPAKAFKLGFLAGMIHYLTLIYWIVVVLGRYGDLNIFLSSFPCFLLCLYLALYIAFFSLLTTSIKGSGFSLLLTGSIWVGLEYFRTEYPIGGFPWCLLGYTQYENLSLIQISDVLGVYGVSFLIVLINGLAFRLLFLLKNKTSRQKDGFLKWEIAIICLTVIGTFAYGHYRLLENQAENNPCKPIRTVIVQGNIDQSLKWDPSYQIKTLEKYIKLTRKSFDSKPELIVWPETSIPFFFQDSSDLSRSLFSIAEESGSALLFGSPAYKKGAGVVFYYNRAYLITPGKTQLQHYDKVHLVPFGEYVPFKNILSFINRLVAAAGDFAEGNKIITLNNDNFSIGVLICFEAIFPQIARIHTKNGANILVNITNDAWFGKTSAPYQHLAMAVFRAVENRRPLVRSANTGFSAFIGPQGKIIEQGSLFCEETLTGIPDISNSTLTFYTRFGDIFAISMLTITLIITCAFFRKKWISRKKSKG